MAPPLNRPPMSDSQITIVDPNASSESQKSDEKWPTRIITQDIKTQPVMPRDHHWWDDTVAPDLFNWEELRHVVTGDGKDKHIFIDFFSPNCKFCFWTQSEFNHVYETLMAEYGEDKLAIYKVNGQTVMDIT